MNPRHCLMLAAVAGIPFSEPAAAQNIGPSTTTEPYVLPRTAGVSTTSILTTGDSVGGYRMVGIPDGLGAWKEGDRTFNLVNNNELGKTTGIPRSHGSKGAFVSRWLIERGTLKVLSGRDHLAGPTSVMTWNGSYTPGTTAFERLCSADLADEDAFSSRGREGTRNRLFLSGEETSPPFSSDFGRMFAHILTGPDKNKSFELPRLGKMSFENALASPFRQDKTIVMLNDDAGRETNVTVANVCRTAPAAPGCVEPPSEVYMYVGSKQSHGNDIEQAGLTNGLFYGVRVRANGNIVTGENKDFVFSSSAPAVTSARFELAAFGDVSNKTGVQIQDEAITKQVTQFIRVEDGAWDPRKGKERDYYFVTTGRITSDAATWRPSRLWRLRFDDIARPEAGGSIKMLLTNQFYAGAATTPDEDPNYQMFDNMTIDGFGRIVLQEDVGANNRLGRVYVYGIDNGELVEVARHNAKFFSGTAATNANFITNDEESSGVIDASDVLGHGWYLFDTQAHRPSPDPELVEGGQLQAMFIHPAIAQKDRGRGRDHENGHRDDED